MPKILETHPSVKEKRSIFSNSIIDPKNYSKNVLKSIKNNTKVGKGKAIITKGKWKGFPVYSLTLEERKTCPTNCHHWVDCYGNNMFLAKRFKAGDSLLKKIEKELSVLAIKYPKGFAIRLHILGDFYSVSYVNFWKSQLELYPNLYIFGYTARIQGTIRKAISKVRLAFPDRWWVRFSTNKANSKKSPNVIYAAKENFKGNSFICPEETGHTESCLTCAACWQSKKTVRFLTH